MKSFYIIILVFFSSCAGKGENQKSVQAISTAETVRDQWLRSRKALELVIETEQVRELAEIGRLGVYSSPRDATLEEQLALGGVPFRYDKEGRFVPEGREIVTGDSAASFYACYPYADGVTPGDTLLLRAPYREYLYGSETGRVFKEHFTVRMKLLCATSLLRLRVESEDLKDRLQRVSVRGEELYTQARYSPYTGEWFDLSGASRPIDYGYDRVMNNYQNVDVLLPPVDKSTDVIITVKMNGKEYVLHTTIPRLKAGEMTQLNLWCNSSGLRVASSWVEEQRSILLPARARVDTVRVGHYLQENGMVSAFRDSSSVAVVFVTDGKHGKAVALKDSPGMKVFSSQRLTSGRVFRTVDGTKKEGFINPSRSDGVADDNKLVYKPALPYPENCALGFADGCGLSKGLLRKYKGTGGDEMLTELLATKGTYVPTVAELALLYYLLQPYGGKPLKADGFDYPEGEYLSSSESSESTFYMFNFSQGIVTGAFSKQFARLKLRLFYIF